MGEGKSHKFAKKEARLFPRDHQWGGKPFQWDPRACGGARGRPSQNTEGCAGTSHWDQGLVRRKDTVLNGGFCCMSDEQVRDQQRRKDTAPEAAWA